VVVNVNFWGVQNSNFQGVDRFKWPEVAGVSVSLLLAHWVWGGR